MQKITCIGFHATGSGAVDDFFKEFSCFNKSISELECRILQDPDGIADLEYNLVENPHRLNSGYALKRYKIMLKRYYGLYDRIFGPGWMEFTDEYIQKLTKTTFNGYWHGDVLLVNPVRRLLYRVRNKLNKKLPKKIALKNKYNFFPEIYTYCCDVNEEQFLEITQDYIEKLCEQMQEENDRYVVLDQFVHPNNIPRYLRYAKDLKVIVVDRDPRDIYIHNFNTRNRTLPHDVETFCKVYRDSRKITAEDTSGRTLNVKFEDLIYKYDETTKKIMNFVGLDESEHTEPRKHFNPNVSIKNTQMWKKFPQFRDAVAIIEKELPEFIYKFEE